MSFWIDTINEFLEFAESIYEEIWQRCNHRLEHEALENPARKGMLVFAWAGSLHL